MTARFAATVTIGLALLGSSGSIARAGSPLQIVASIAPAAVLYGDPVTAALEVDYAPHTVDPASIRVQPSFIPYVVSSAPVVEHVRSGVVRFRYSLLCVTEGCLPGKGPRLLHFERATVTARAGNQTVTAAASWPTLQISSRLTASDLAKQVRFRNPTTPPSAAYRVAPGPLSAGLIAGAALCALVAAALGAREVAKRFPRAKARRLTPLELAIAYVRDSTRRTDPDRRRALALLAEAVDRSGEPALAATASNRAWSKPPPTPAGTTELADRAAGLQRGTE